MNDVRRLRHPNHGEEEEGEVDGRSRDGTVEKGVEEEGERR